MNTSEIDTMVEDLQNSLLEAIRSGSVFDASAFYGLSPADGYRVQAEVFAALGLPLRGSKLALKSDACHSASLLWVGDADRYAYQPGVMIEVELALVLGGDIGCGAAPVTRQDVVEAIGSIRIGVELCRSRYDRRSRVDQALTVADMMSNSGYMLGTSLNRNLLEHGAPLGQLSVLIDGQAAFDRPATHPNGDPLKALVALANQSPFTCVPLLEKGQVITTGSLCGVIPVTGPGTIEVRLGGEPFKLALFGRDQD